LDLLHIDCHRIATGRLAAEADILHAQAVELEQAVIDTVAPETASGPVRELDWQLAGRGSAGVLSLVGCSPRDNVDPGFERGLRIDQHRLPMLERMAHHKFDTGFDPGVAKQSGSDDIPGSVGRCVLQTRQNKEYPARGRQNRDVAGRIVAAVDIATAG
jgi:hypothetical protein